MQYNQFRNFLFFIFFISKAFTVDTSIDNTLPKFLIIGAQKSGTTAFYGLLRQHPQIVNKPGEVHFFDFNFHKGEKWYKAQFPKWEHSDAIRGDKSPYYLFHPLVPQRAYSLLPHAKLIILLRNPIDRAYSHYWMNFRAKRETLSFEDAIHAEPERLAGSVKEIIRTGITQTSPNHLNFSYLSRGIYVDQLKNWMNYYNQDQILVISFDDFLQNPEEQIKKTLKFLELPDYDNFNFQIGKQSKYPSMDPIIRKELSDYFRPYNEQLEMLLNKKFNWN